MVVEEPLFQQSYAREAAIHVVVIEARRAILNVLAGFGSSNTTSGTNLGLCPKLRLPPQRLGVAPSIPSESLLEA